MNFTREPIIETIITPREGFKLIVRNSKGGDQEEHSVDALEVVSFGASFFFRSLERPKPFLVPVSDYEVLEMKETRVVLKNASVEKTIKISGGREANIKPSKELSGEKPESPAEVAAKKNVSLTSLEQRLEKKREKRRHRRRRGGQEENKENVETSSHTPLESPPNDSMSQGGDAVDETKVSSSMFSRFFPPPTTLISETLGRDKKKDEEVPQGDISSESIEAQEKESEWTDEPPSNPPDDQSSSDDQPWGGDSKDMLRLGSESAQLLAPPQSSSFFHSIDPPL